jgi:phage-related protein
MREKWRVFAYETNRGEKPITEFISIQQEQAIAKITHMIDLLEIHGPMLGMPHAKKLTANLYELRIRGKEEIRIIYGYKQRIIYLLHAFKKQTQKTPKKELQTALQRMSSIDRI